MAKYPQEKRIEMSNTALALAEENLFGTSNDGLCLQCGSVQGGCEPDARKYKCEDCGKHTVYGAEEAVMVLGLC